MIAVINVRAKWALAQSDGDLPEPGGQAKLTQEPAAARQNDPPGTVRLNGVVFSGPGKIEIGAAINAKENLVANRVSGGLQ